MKILSIHDKLDKHDKHDKAYKSKICNDVYLSKTELL